MPAGVIYCSLFGIIDHQRIASGMQQGDAVVPRRSRSRRGGLTSWRASRYASGSVAPTIGGGGNSPLAHSKKARAKPRCSICKSLDHNKGRCPQKNIVVARRRKRQHAMLMAASTTGSDDNRDAGLDVDDVSDGSTAGTSSGRSLDQPRGKMQEVVVVRRHRRRRAMLVRASTTSGSSDNSDDGWGVDGVVDGSCAGAGDRCGGPSSRRSSARLRGVQSDVTSLWDLEDPKCL